MKTIYPVYHIISSETFLSTTGRLHYSLDVGQQGEETATAQEAAMGKMSFPIRREAPMQVRGIGLLCFFLSTLTGLPSLSWQ
jgi:hypothetical protein